MGGEWGWAVVVAAVAAKRQETPKSVLVAGSEPVITGNKIKHGPAIPCGWDERDAKV